MKKSELNDMTPTELKLHLKDNLDAFQNLQFQKAVQQLENPVKIHYLKKEIAQIKTVIREYELGIRASKDKEA